MCNGVLLVLLLSITAIIIISLLCSQSKENFTPRCNVEDESHCPKKCSPFMYPDMYSPRGACSDPFSWGYTYTTGRCPKLLS
jgi:hypothetical protein